MTQSTIAVHYLIVEYPDHTFRVYCDELHILREYEPKKGERCKLVTRRENELSSGDNGVLGDLSRSDSVAPVEGT